MFIETWLVSLLAGSILAGLLGIAGYMWKWNIADAAWKADVAARLERIDIDLRSITNVFNVMPVLGQKIVDMERRLERLEE